MLLTNAKFYFHGQELLLAFCK